jgi:glycosyltransferase involved in cell wall biosynthesis
MVSGCEGRRVKPIEIALVVYGLSDNWLGGVNYFRNLVAVFDGAGEQGLRLNVLANDPSYFADLKLSARVRVHRVPMLEHRTPAWWVRKLLAKALGRDAMLVRELQRLDVRLVVFSHVSGAAAAGIRCMPWIPDFQSQHHPEFFQREVVAIERQRAIDWLRECDGLIVSSQTARDDAMRLFNAAPAQLRTLRFAPKLEVGMLAEPALRDEVLARHGVDRPYIFVPNQYWQHKNHTLVVKALKRLRDQGRALPLVVSTGKTEDMRRPTYFAEFEAALQAAGVQSAYRVLGVIDRRDMLVLLAHAAVVLNPSRFEGWSTSVEEAKALGKTLWVSDIPVHREQIVGLADAQLFGVDDDGALAALLARPAQQGGAVTDHPPRPQPALYKRFESEFMALLAALAAVKETTP